MTTRLTFLSLAALLAAGGCGDASPPAAAPPPVGTEVGSTAPQLAGRLPGGEPFRLERRGDSTRVLVFYRGGDCGLCRLRLEGLRDHHEGYRRLGAAVVAVTAEPPEQAGRTAQRVGAAFPIVSVSPEALAEWAVVDSTRGVPLPATYVVDGNGVIRYRHVGRNAADRASDAGILVLLERMRAAGD